MLFDWALDVFEACGWSFGAVVLAGLALNVPSVGDGCAVAVLIVAPLIAGWSRNSRRVGGLVAALLGATVAVLYAAFQRPIFWGL